MRELDERPDALHRLHDRRQQRSTHADCEVDTGRRVTWRVHVVDDVDPANEGDAAVDMAEFAVQAPQAVRAKLPGGDLGPVLEKLHVGVPETLLQCRCQEMACTPAVDQHANANPSCRGVGQRIGHPAPGGIVGEDIGLEPDFALRGREGLEQRRKILRTVAQQRDSISRHVAVHREAGGSHAQCRRFGASAKVAASAA